MPKPIRPSPGCLGLFRSLNLAHFITFFLSSPFGRRKPTPYLVPILRNRPGIPASVSLSFSEVDSSSVGCRLPVLSSTCCFYLFYFSSSLVTLSASTQLLISYSSFSFILICVFLSFIRRCLPLLRLLQCMFSFSCFFYSCGPVSCFSTKNCCLC